MSLNKLYANIVISIIINYYKTQGLTIDI